MDFEIVGECDALVCFGKPPTFRELNEKFANVPSVLMKRGFSRSHPCIGVPKNGRVNTTLARLRFKVFPGPEQAIFSMLEFHFRPSVIEEICTMPCSCMPERGYRRITALGDYITLTGGKCYPCVWKHGQALLLDLALCETWQDNDEFLATKLSKSTF